MNQTETATETIPQLRAALARHGNQQRLAETIGCTRQAVARWLRVGEVSPDFVLLVEAATGIHRHHLNPRIYPDPPALLAATARR